MKQATEEDKNMGPKFRATEKPKADWGEDTIGHEDWADDPDETDSEEETEWEEDFWEEDCEETDQAQNASTVTPAPVPTSAVPEPSGTLATDWDDDDDDDWEEDIARATGQ